MARPPKYATENDKPVSVTFRIPRDVYDKAQQHARMRQTTLTELVLEGLRWRLETPTDPRDILAIQEITVMQELRQMIAEEVRAAWATQSFQVPETTSTRQKENKSKTEHYSNSNTGQASEPEPGHSMLTEPTPQRTAGNQPRAYGEVPAAVLAVLAQRQSATPAEIAQALGDNSKKNIKTIWQALQRLATSGRVRKDGKRYHLAA